MITIRRTMGPVMLITLAATLRGLMYGQQNSVSADLAIGNGTTAGHLRTNAASEHKIAGITQAPVASTDDFWDMSAEVDTDAASYRAYWLYSDGTFVAGSDHATAQDALESLPALDDTLAVFGVYVAGPATDFDDAGGLAAQGTITNGVADYASGVRIDTDLELVAP